MNHTQLFRSIPGALLAAMVATSAACNEGPGETSGFVPTHVSLVRGTVVSQNGTPLESVVVAITPDARAGYSYASPRPETNKRGEFTYEVQRMVAPPVVLQPDTVTATVQVMGLKAAYDVNGERSISQARVLLTFVPRGSTPVASTVQVTLTIPN